MGTNSLTFAVFKAVRETDLWKGHPIVWRLAFMPVYVSQLVALLAARENIVLVVMGNRGREMNILNSEALVNQAESSEMFSVGYCVENVYTPPTNTEGLSRALMLALYVTQFMVWCVQGTDMKLIELGEAGFSVPEWAIETEQAGPRITGLRVKVEELGGVA